MERLGESAAHAAIICQAIAAIMLLPMGRCLRHGAHTIITNS
jgi:hypothetical protein